MNVKEYNKTTIPMIIEIILYEVLFSKNVIIKAAGKKLRNKKEEPIKNLIENLITSRISSIMLFMSWSMVSKWFAFWNSLGLLGLSDYTKQ
tara:strand:+ start:125 stop:397 length:273 start_codon:yes stop_codon:yes gene_type:complete